MGKSIASGAPRVSSAATLERARAARRARLLDFLADPPAEVLAAAEALGRAREHYGDDTDRELADLQAGWHLLQPQKTKPARR